ncbi:MAG: hypothetical protein CMQ54_04730 [Gammaproteobacteria bacterium]|nr:hypothetical protein [Gammaproteobacteria bacterium]|tara:strand:+ start:2779 stop:3711 length:933 start_codon:yes stop_codon:yes gene_type:complete
MHLIALLLGLTVERLATHFLHWRRMYWLDLAIDFGLHQTRHIRNWSPIFLVTILIILMVLPVFLVIYSFGDTLKGLTYLVLSVIVLFFSIGPKDLGEEIDEYCNAIMDDNNKEVKNTANALIEGKAPEDPYKCNVKVEEAICIQANNRLFGVIFWFVFMGSFTGSIGPLAAWTYRVTDLIRRRAISMKSSDGNFDNYETNICEAAVFLHGIMAWIPARLTALGYATAGHADNAIAALRSPVEDIDASLPKSSEQLLARVGFAALALVENEDETINERGVRGAMAAKKLVFRLLFIWAVIIAMLTLYGFTR